MARDLGTANTAQVTATEIRPLVFAELAFDTGTLWAHSGIGNITWGSRTWLGVGDLAGVGSIDEGVDVSARGVTLSLNGIPSEILAAALGIKYRGRSSKLWLGFLNSSGALVADPYQAFAGRMDVIGLEDGGGDSCSTSVQCENRMVDMRRAKTTRYTNEEQKARHPGDNGLMYIARLPDQTLHWGVPNPVSVGSAQAR